MTGPPAEPHPEPAPPLTGMAKAVDALDRNQGRFFAAMAALVIFLTLVYGM